MKKKIPILLIIIIMITSLILLIPSQMYANGLPPIPPNEDIVITVNKGDSDSPTKIKICGTNVPQGEWGYAFYIVKYAGTIEEFSNESDQDSFIVYEDYGTFVIEEENGADCISYTRQLSEGHYFAFIFIFDEDGGEIVNPTGAGVGYTQFTPSSSISSIAQGELVAWNYKEFTISQAEPEPWVRGDRDMVCYQVWVNDDNCFELVFWWEYEDNNWVRIYDMEGNMVYEVDMPYQDASIEVCLPDGMYTVKTFHDQPEPLQEFVIGKP